MRLSRSTWTFSTPATRLALAVTRGMQELQVTVGTRYRTSAVPAAWPELPVPVDAAGPQATINAPTRSTRKHNPENL